MIVTILRWTLPVVLFVVFVSFIYTWKFVLQYNIAVGIERRCPKKRAAAKEYIEKRGGFNPHAYAGAIIWMIASAVIVFSGTMWMIIS
ncbi:MAG: hypothetical protein V4467_00370 [Patescibacteria group bacterium]